MLTNYIKNHIYMKRAIMHLNKILKCIKNDSFVLASCKESAEEIGKCY